MPKRRADDETLEVIDAVLEHLERVKDDTARVIAVLLKTRRGHKRAGSRRAQKRR
jgi:hypothetical protein